MIDLVSDTATKPTAGMREAIAQADVGDEQRHEDPTVTLLCERVADMLGAEAALLLPSGIMSNLVSVVVHCRPGDEVVTAANAHVVGSEGAGAAAIGGVQMALIDAPDGRFDAPTLKAHVRANRARAPRPSLIWVENTSNAGGGTCWKLNSLAAISDVAKAHDCRMHLDGARLLNAAIATNTPPADICRFFDSAWIDLSKGLGCPIGSVLAGSRAFIDEAWVWKHRLGGAMRQAGIIAAAGLYALDHHVDRLAEDHANAQRLAQQLRDISGVKVVGDAVETNIVFVDVSGTAHSAAEIASALEAYGMRMGVSGSSKLRAVTHLGVSASDVDAAAQAFRRAVTSPS
ncbi:MAG: GntG family PLP-dependent aldolase [Pseudomonadota bacterium]